MRRLQPARSAILASWAILCDLISTQIYWKVCRKTWIHARIVQWLFNRGVYHGNTLIQVPKHSASGTSITHPSHSYHHRKTS